jgi:hypothetical protein
VGGYPVDEVPRTARGSIAWLQRRAPAGDLATPRPKCRGVFFLCCSWYAYQADAWREGLEDAAEIVGSPAEESDDTSSLWAQSHR